MKSLMAEYMTSNKFQDGGRAAAPILNIEKYCNIWIVAPIFTKFVGNVDPVTYIQISQVKNNVVTKTKMTAAAISNLEKVLQL